MKSNDLEQFSIALAKLATPLTEEQRKQVKSATKGIRGPHTDSFEKPTDADLEKTFPLPPEHEINQPLDESSHYDEGMRHYIFLPVFNLRNFQKSFYLFTKCSYLKYRWTNSFISLTGRRC